jgi:gp16 family phage-associated protein
MDRQATKAKFEQTGRTAAGWARSRGFDPERIRSVLRGRFNATAEEVEALRADGLLVEEKKAA